MLLLNEEESRVWIKFEEILRLQKFSLRFDFKSCLRLSFIQFNCLPSMKINLKFMHSPNSAVFQFKNNRKAFLC